MGAIGYCIRNGVLTYVFGIALGAIVGVASGALRDDPHELNLTLWTFISAWAVAVTWLGFTTAGHDALEKALTVERQNARELRAQLQAVQSPPRANPDWMEDRAALPGWLQRQLDAEDNEG